MNPQKERPIIFNSDMVRAILENRKSQTRRVIKPQLIITLKNGEDWNCNKKHDLRFGVLYYGVPHKIIKTKNQGERLVALNCPYGEVGDLLWVQETWGWSGLDRLEYKAFPADGKDFRSVNGWKPPQHMHLQWSRITLEITDVRVERVQEISEEDAQAEGIARLIAHGKDLGSYVNYLWHGEIGRTITVKQSDAWAYQYSGYQKARDSFSSLWNSIYKKHPWKSNPWVWVIEFKQKK